MLCRGKINPELAIIIKEEKRIKKEKKRSDRRRFRKQMCNKVYPIDEEHIPPYTMCCICMLLCAMP